MAQGVQKKTEYAGLQFLGVSAVKKLLGFEIREAPGEHARGKFRVRLSEEAPVVCERNVPGINSFLPNSFLSFSSASCFDILKGSITSAPYG